MKYLLDTNVISEMTKPEPNQAVTAWLGLIPITEVALSVITLGEIQRGILATPSEKKRAALQQWYDQSFLPMFSGGILSIWTQAQTPTPSTAAEERE